MIDQQVLADMLGRNLAMLKNTLADFNDADMLARPAPSANHAAWQLGHVTNAEASMVAGAKPQSVSILPAGFAAKFAKSNASIDDPKFFPGKAELLETLSKVRAATIEWVRGLTPQEMAQPTPERLHMLAPTIAHMALLIPNHLALHIGQFQVIRRKLGKPVLF